MAGFREEIVHLVQKSMKTFSSIESADHQLNGLQTLNLMKRDLARNRIKETVHDFQVKIAAVAAQDLQAVMGVVREREAQLADERGSLTTAKNMLLGLLQEAKTVVTARAGDVTCQQAEKLIARLKMLIDTDYSPRHWDGLDYLEFIPHPPEAHVNLGFLRTSALDPRELLLKDGAGNKKGTLRLGQPAVFSLDTGFTGEINERLVELLSAEVTGPNGEAVQHTLKEGEGSSAVKLKFDVKEEGRYVIDVKIYETSISMCPLTLKTVKGNQSVRRRATDNIIQETDECKDNLAPLLSKADLGRGDETQSPPLPSPSGCSPAEGKRTYGPRARRQSSEDSSPGKVQKDILTGINNLKLEDHSSQGRPSTVSEGKENKFSFRTQDSSPMAISPMVIQPKEFSENIKIKTEPVDEVKPVPKHSGEGVDTSSKKTSTSSETISKKTTYDGLGVARHLFMSNPRTSASSQSHVERQTSKSSSSANSKDTSDRKVSPSDVDKNWRSKEGKPLESSREVGIEEIRNIPLPKEPYVPERKKTLVTIPPSRPFSCLTNLMNLFLGKDLPAKKIVEIGSTAKTLAFPIGLATTKTTDKPDVVVCDTGHNIVKVFSWTGTLKMELKTEEWGISFRRPSSAVVGSSGDIFIKDDNAIYRFSSAGDFIMKIGEKTLARPYGLAKTKDGYLVTLDHRKGIMVFDPATGACIKRLFFPPLNSPSGLAKFRFIAVHEDTLIAVNLGEHTVVFFNLESGQVMRTIGGLGNAGNGPGQFKEPSGVTVDEFGNLLVADSKNNRVQVFDMQGNFRCRVGFDDPIWRPSDIHVTEDGFLVVDIYLHHKVRVYRLG